MMVMLCDGCFLGWLICVCEVWVVVCTLLILGLLSVCLILILTVGFGF